MNHAQLATVGSHVSPKMAMIFKGCCSKVNIAMKNLGALRTICCLYDFVYHIFVSYYAHSYIHAHHAYPFISINIHSHPWTCPEKHPFISPKFPIWRFPEIGVPLVIIQSNGIFPSKPTILGGTPFMENHIFFPRFVGGCPASGSWSTWSGATWCLWRTPWRGRPRWSSCCSCASTRRYASIIPTIDILRHWIWWSYDGDVQWWYMMEICRVPEIGGAPVHHPCSWDFHGIFHDKDW